MNACTRIVDTGTSQAGTFQVVFARDEESPAGAIYSELGFFDDAQHNALAMWSEETQQALDYPLPTDIYGPKISTDHHWILFRRDVNQTQSELWVIGTDGKNETKLDTVEIDDELRSRYPDSYFGLNYGWIRNTHKFFYYVDASEEFGSNVFERFTLADADSGQLTPLTLPPEIRFFLFSPSGYQMAAATGSDLYLIDTQDGRVQFTVPDFLNNPRYSPDGQYLIDFTNEGIVRINTAGGNSLTIPLKYTIMLCCPGGEGPMLRALPHFEWVDDSTLAISSLISDQQFVIRPFEADPGGWMFTTWRVDIVDGTTTPGATFNGDPDSVVFSADGSRIAFANLESTGETRSATELRLADANTGEVLENFSSKNAPLPVFIAWSPDSKHYVYWHDSGGRTPDEHKIQELLLGEIGAEPMYIGNLEGARPEIHWLDSRRFSLQMGICLITGYETINLISLDPPVQVMNIAP